jgi:hypothetical protein
MKKEIYSLVPIVIPAGECVNVGNVVIRLNEDVKGETSYRSLSLTEIASRTVVVPNPAHIPPNWKTYKVFAKSSSSDELSNSNISAADLSEEMKNSPSENSDAQKSNCDDKTSDNASSNLGLPAEASVMRNGCIILENGKDDPR